MKKFENLQISHFQWIFALVGVVQIFGFPKIGKKNSIFSTKNVAIKANKRLNCRSKTRLSYEKRKYEYFFGKVQVLVQKPRF